MTDADFLRYIARLGYSVWEDGNNSTAKRLYLIANKLESYDPPPPRQSDR